MVKKKVIGTSLGIDYKMMIVWLGRIFFFLKMA